MAAPTPTSSPNLTAAIDSQLLTVVVEFDALRDLLSRFMEHGNITARLPTGTKLNISDMSASDILRLAQLIVQVKRAIHVTEVDTARAVLEQARASLNEHRCGTGQCHCCKSINAIDTLL